MQEQPPRKVKTMSKPKKPAEDKSKAGAVTNSIADEVNGAIIFSAKHVGFWSEVMSDDVRGGRVAHLMLDIPSLKSELLTLIADRERKARVEGMLQMAEILKKRSLAVDLLIPFDNGSVKQYFEELDRAIATLQAEDKGGQE